LRYALLLRATAAAVPEPGAVPAERARMPEAAAPVVTAPAVTAGGTDMRDELLLDVPLEPAPPAPRSVVIHPVLPAAPEPVAGIPSPPVVEPAGPQPVGPEPVAPEPLILPADETPIASDAPPARRHLARLVPVIGIAAVIVLATLWVVVREWRWLSLPPERRDAIARTIIDRWRGEGAYAALDAKNARRWTSPETP
jgi:hypothetical protein